jgi:hypothetical protein
MVAHAAMLPGAAKSASCKAARLQGCKAALASPGHHPQHTLLLANRLTQASNERARLEIEVLVAKVVKDLRS